MARYHLIRNRKEVDYQKKAMISQPMNGLSDEEIKFRRQEAIKQLELMGYEFVDSFIEDNPTDDGISNIPIWYLAKSIEIMSKCDAVYFCNGYENNRGCVIEHHVAIRYGLETIEECYKVEEE